MLDLGNQSFDTFELDWYPEGLMPGKACSYRHHMEVKVLDYCKEFAMGFGKRPGNLLLFGAPGLGKTHLSAAIAREVSAEGWSVVYDTAAHVFERFENQKFSREEDAEVSSDVERILNCDLLILDDLGTEMTTAFVQSALYQIINTRLMEKKSTIINSNLSPDKIAQRYSAQIASRIEGEYHILGFVGEDIRKLKKQRM
jgi:DNA replication protein DnaC